VGAEKAHYVISEKSWVKKR